MRGKYARHWTVLADGGSDQWLYVRASGSTYVFVEVIDLPAYCGRDADVLFVASVATVDLADASPETVARALDSCGYDEPLDLTVEQDRLALAEMLFSYGAKSPLFELSGGVVRDPHDRPSERHPAFMRVRAEARRYAETLLDPETRDRELDSRVVNRLGQTAREYARGTSALWDSLRRIRDAGDDATAEQKIVLRMYQKAGQTLGAGPVPVDLMVEP